MKLIGFATAFLLLSVIAAPAQQQSSPFGSRRPLLFAAIRDSEATVAATEGASYDGIVVAHPAKTVAQPASEPAFTLRKSVREVRLDFSVTDRAGHAVAGLRQSDLVINDDGQLVSSIAALTREGDIPLRIAVLLDSSWSTEKDLPFEKQAALRFVNSVLAPQDRALVAGFANHLTCVQGFTNDRALLSRGVDPIATRGLTALNDSVYQVIAEQFAAAEQPTDSRVRNVLVILTDGYDSYSLKSLDDGIREAVRNGITIYTISSTGHVNDTGQRAIDRMTQMTGGRAISAKKMSELDSAFSEISDDLHSYYSVAYPAPGRAGFHPVAISLTNSNTFRIRVRSGYYAENPTSQSASLH